MKGSRGESMYHKTFGNMIHPKVGEFDVPAMIDKIRYKTGVNKIFFAAFSMGTTSYMVMANRRPEYLNYVEFASFLAPVAYVDHMTSPMRFIAPFTGQIDVSEYTYIQLEN